MLTLDPTHGYAGYGMNDVEPGFDRRRNWIEGGPPHFPDVAPTGPSVRVDNRVQFGVSAGGRASVPRSGLLPPVHSCAWSRTDVGVAELDGTGIRRAAGLVATPSAGLHPLCLRTAACAVVPQ
jgi:hypothetical protein